MKVRQFPFSLILFASLAGSSGGLTAGDATLAEMLTRPTGPSPWRVGAGYAQLLGLDAEFTGLGTFRSAFTPQPLGGGINYDYDDGYVHLDSSNNLGDETWNWSYANASQLDSSGTGSIDLSITNSLANGRAADDGAAEAGVELFAYYDMGAVEIPLLKDRQCAWGFRGGLQYSPINLGSNASVATGLATTTDTFNLNGNIAPLAPYTGSFGGPGPLLGDSPTRSTSTAGTGMVAGNRDLDVDLAILQFGTYLEMPVTKRLSVMVEAGLSLGIASGSYDFFSATTAPGLGTQTSAGSTSHTSVLPGIYAGIGSVYRIDDKWSVMASARYQYMDEFELSTNGSAASLSFDSAFVLSLAVVYRF